MFTKECGVVKCVDPAAAMQTFPERRQLMVVNDDSVDATESILGSLQRQYGDVLVRTHDQNRGYGVPATKVAVLILAYFVYVFRAALSLMTDTVVVLAI